MREYRIVSKMGAWPEVWTFNDDEFDRVQLRSLASDLAYNRHFFPHREFWVEVREVSPWRSSAIDPVVPYEDRFDDAALDAWLVDQPWSHLT